MARNVHVVHRNGMWLTQFEGPGTFSTSHESRDEAVATGLRMAKTERSKLLVHELDGSIRRQSESEPKPSP